MKGMLFQSGLIVIPIWDENDMELNVTMLGWSWRQRDAMSRCDILPFFGFTCSFFGGQTISPLSVKM
jgi:hypothetical protein